METGDDERKNLERVLRTFKPLSSRQLNELKFRWSIWSENARLFWRRATISTAVNLIFYLYEAGVIRSDPWQVFGFGTTQPTLNREQALGILLAQVLGLLVCAFLIVFTGFSFVDLMRHRMKNELEDLLHENWLELPFFGVTNIRNLGRKLYNAVLGFYMLIVGLGWCFSACYLVTAWLRYFEVL